MSLYKSGLPEPTATYDSNRKKILWLVSWYPNRFDAFDGDFIQRHARAAALYDDITVLFIKQAAAQRLPEKVEHRQQGLTERWIYLPKKQGWYGKLSGFYQWQKTARQEAAWLVENEQPHLVHVHVPWKAGLLALWLRYKFRIPYLVTEHWGIYNKVVGDNIHTRSLLFRRWLQRIFQKAAGVTSVSRFLGEGINQTLLRKPFTVIPNVVDTTLFYPAGARAGRFTFLHVSNMVALKNVEGILEAFRQYWAKTNSTAQLVLVGNQDERFPARAMEMGLLNKSVFFRGEIPYPKVAHEMQAAHVLVVNSDMENSPCVIGEALCCGLPVLATNVGGIPELVTPENSILVPPRDVQALVDAFEKMETTYHRFDSEKIATKATKLFSFPAVGQLLHQLYHRSK